MEKKEFAIGKEFQMGLKRLRVEKQKKGECRKNCDGCAFQDIICDFVADYVGDCRVEFRTDKTDVIFVEVK